MTTPPRWAVFPVAVICVALLWILETFWGKREPTEAQAWDDDSE